MFLEDVTLFNSFKETLVTLKTRFPSPKSLSKRSSPSETRNLCLRCVTQLLQLLFVKLSCIEKYCSLATIEISVSMFKRETFVWL